MPELVQHPADPGHDLKFLLTPCFHCRAWGHQGAGSFYHCHLCQVQYHSLCLLMPLAKGSHSHPHELHLKFFPPYGDFQGFCCDLWGNPGFDRGLYRYHCLTLLAPSSSFRGNSTCKACEQQVNGSFSLQLCRV
ncbi:hypothetical protein EUGRSUZ_A02455 [Eucalyptus grandis]|uniref:Uncharacterized protein n=2 Tax=Eucalyptus grandis TaxID=71139 RepID=A0ACC3M6N3_EUCGR|nr:hypothetical protein EUGRSUZ_A02455 [Eucalyptus grandis]